MDDAKSHKAVAYGAAALSVMALLFVWRAPVDYVYSSASRYLEPAAAERVVGSNGNSFIDAPGVQTPQTYLARVDIEKFHDADRRTVGAKIQSARLLGLVDASSGSPIATPDVTEEDRSTSLVGQHVLASVNAEIADKIDEGEAHTVQLVLVPSEKGAVFAIDRLVEDGQGGVVGAAAVSARVESLSAYASPPGSKVIVYGRDFGADMGDSSVMCSGVRAEVIAWSDTAVAFRVPAAAVKPGYVGVVVNGVTSNGLYFVPYVAPRVTAITPANGSAGVLVTLTGTDFGAQQGDGWVTFGGTAAQVVSWGDTEIEVRVPQGISPGYAGVVRHGLSSNGIYFAPYGHPRVESVSRTRVLAGEVVTLAGRDFGVAGEVVLAGQRIKADTWSNTQVTFTVPADSPSGYVGVRRNSALTSNGIYVTVAPRLRTISSWWGVPGGQLTVTGEGFGATQGTKKVVIGGVAADVVSWSDTQVVATIPDTGSGYVGVGTSSAMSNGIYFVVVKPARIETVDAKTVRPGQLITIAGSDFGEQKATSRVTIAGACTCTPETWTDTVITARVPDNVQTGYVGVIKQGVASNGVWVQAVP